MGIHGEDNISNFMVFENESYNNQQGGIWFAEVRNSLIKRNLVYNSTQGHGIVLSQASGNHHNLVCENDVYDSFFHGISIDRNLGGGDTFSSVIGNRVWNSGQSGINVTSSADINTVAFNLCYNNQGSGIAVGSLNNTVYNNYLTGNQHNTVQGPASNTIVEGVINNTSVYWATPPGGFVNNALTQTYYSHSTLWLNQGNGWLDTGDTPLCVDVTERWNDCHDCLLIETFRMLLVGSPLQCSPTPPDPITETTAVHTCFSCSVPGVSLAADISGPQGVSDCHVDVFDLAALASHWLECSDESNPSCGTP